MSILRSENDSVPIPPLYPYGPYPPPPIPIPPIPMPNENGTWAVSAGFIFSWGSASVCCGDGMAKATENTAAVKI